MKKYKIHFIEKESDVSIISESKRAIERARSSFFHHRTILEKYVAKSKLFLESLNPLNTKSDLEIIDLMIRVSQQCHVGPMATVAGALADLMVANMMKKDKNYMPPRVALVENGGEIAINSVEDVKIGLYAGENVLNIKVGFLIKKSDNPMGIGTSSATIGHALSFGEADAVTIFADNATLADGAATYVANLVKGDDVELSIQKGLDAVDDISNLKGAFISRDNKVGIVGKIPEMFRIKDDIKYFLKGKIEDLLSSNGEIIK